jgi:hypothetical protein
LRSRSLTPFDRRALGTNMAEVTRGRP